MPCHPKLVPLIPLLLAATVLAEIPDPFPADPIEAPDALFLSAGLDELHPALAVRFRKHERYEYAFDVGAIPDAQIMELRVNFLAANPEPKARGTWYGGTGLTYMHDDGPRGKFQLGFISGVAGREKRLGDRWRFDWEAGLGVMAFYSFKGGGAPILFPVVPMLRAEILYGVI